MSKPVRRSLAAAATAPLLLLAGCGDRTSSVADPPVSAPSPSSTAGPPRHESPQAFIRRWAVEDTRIQRTGQTASFRAMSRHCEGCLEFADLVDRIYKNGGYVRTRGWRVRRIEKVDVHMFDLFVVASPTTYVTSRTGSVHHLPSGPAQFQLRLTKRGSSWNVASLIQLAAS